MVNRSSFSSLLSSNVQTRDSSRGSQVLKPQRHWSWQLKLRSKFRRVHRTASRANGYFREQFHQTLGEISVSKPDAVVLIDYPGFNLRLARALRRQSQSQKTIYYISPQVWAWNWGRIKEMARLIDLVLCIFPFEANLYS